MSSRSFLATLGSDASALVQRLAGGRPRPVARVTIARVPRPQALAPRAMRVAAVQRETADAVRIRLVDEAAERLEFVPGQFLTLAVSVDGVEHRRAYSICSPESERGGFTVACKRVPGGIVSSYLVDRLRDGESVGVLGPSGSFRVSPAVESGAPLVLVGGGSGITPLLSIMTSVLDALPRARVSLLYGNRRLDDVMFRDDLDALVRAHQGRLRVRHVLEHPPAAWTGGVGRLERDVFARELDALLVDAVDGSPCEWMLCGPEPMMRAAREELDARGVASACIRQERFLTRARGAAPSPVPPSPQRVVLHSGGRRFELVAGAGQTLLEAGLAAGVRMPFSCAVGGCGECRVHLTSGRVEMDEPNCLLPEERTRGFVLACVARPSTAVEIAVAPQQGESP